MNRRFSGGDGITVIKIGGGLSLMDGALDRACAIVSRAAQSHRILVVPGGGPFADSVREFDRVVGLSRDAAHWMAILAMDQFAQVLAERIKGAELVDEPGAIQGAVAQNTVAVLAPFRWMRSADVLPHAWEVTSDSIAAFVAGALGATRLILIKPASDIPDPVDPYFFTALPVGLPYSVIGCDRLEELFQQLSG
jgi:5-(aminomethyl)-3-furanmethanol phosphate kinase